MPIVRVNGVDTHVQEMGTGRPVFLAHGLILDNLASWYLGIAPRLASTRRIVAYDLRGHGMSGRAASGYDSESLALDLAALIEELAPGEEVDVAGASYGGLVALRYALARPERVGRVALVDAPLPPRRYEEIDGYLDANIETLVAALPDQLRSEVRRSSRRAVRLARSVSLLVEKTSLLEDVRGEREIPGSLFAAFDGPVLGLYGTESPFREDGERLASLMSRAEIELIRGGHRLLNERPAEVGSRLARFFDA